MEQDKLNPLVALGLGAGIGVCSLWILLEIWPALVLGGAVYLIYKGTQNKKKETQHNADMDKE